MVPYPTPGTVSSAVPSPGSATESTYTSTAGVSGDRWASRSNPFSAAPAPVGVTSTVPALRAVTASTRVQRSTGFLQRARGADRSSPVRGPFAHSTRLLSNRASRGEVGHQRVRVRRVAVGQQDALLG